MFSIDRMTMKQIKMWRYRRLAHGKEKYKDAHLYRNGPVDVAEEILDAQNILLLHRDKFISIGTYPYPVAIVYNILWFLCFLSILFLRILSCILPIWAIYEKDDIDRI